MRLPAVKKSIVPVAMPIDIRRVTVAAARPGYARPARSSAASPRPPARRARDAPRRRRGAAARLRPT